MFSTKKCLHQKIINLPGHTSFANWTVYDKRKAQYLLVVPKSHLNKAGYDNFCFTRKILFKAMGENLLIPFVWEYVAHVILNIISDDYFEKYKDIVDSINNFRYSYIQTLLESTHVQIDQSKIQKHVTNQTLVYSTPLAFIGGSTTIKSDIDVTLFMDIIREVFYLHSGMFQRSSLCRLFDVNFYVKNFESPTCIPNAFTYNWNNVQLYLITNETDEITRCFSLKRLYDYFNIAYEIKASTLKTNLHRVCFATLTTIDQYHTCSAYKHIVLNMIKNVNLSLTKEEYLESLYENLGFFADKITNVPCYTQLFVNFVKCLKYVYRVYNAASLYHAGKNQFVNYREATFKLVESIRTAKNPDVSEYVNTLNRNVYDEFLKQGCSINKHIIQFLFREVSLADDYDHASMHQIVVHIVKELNGAGNIPFPQSVLDAINFNKRVSRKCIDKVKHKYHNCLVFNTCLKDIEDPATYMTT